MLCRQGKDYSCYQACDQSIYLKQMADLKALLPIGMDFKGSLKYASACYDMDSFDAYLDCSAALNPGSDVGNKINEVVESHLVHLIRLFPQLLCCAR